MPKVYKNTYITHTHKKYTLCFSNKKVKYKEIKATFKILHHVHPDKFRGMCVINFLLGSHKCQKPVWYDFDNEKYVWQGEKTYGRVKTQIFIC